MVDLSSMDKADDKGESPEHKPGTPVSKKLPPTPPLPPHSNDNKLSSDKPKTPEHAGKPEKSIAKSGKSPAKSYEILTASETWSLAESMDR